MLGQARTGLVRVFFGKNAGTPAQTGQILLLKMK